MTFVSRTLSPILEGQKEPLYCNNVNSRKEENKSSLMTHALTNGSIWGQKRGFIIELPASSYCAISVHGEK